MAVLVDTNVICDVLYNDPHWAKWSSTQLTQHWGQLNINPMIYAELCYQASTNDEVDGIVMQLNLTYTELPQAALFAAAHAYRRYRQRGGVKTAPLPDFFIGAHAEVSGMTLITRDKGRYATYFAGVQLICP